ncbi:amidase domain-containing protein [Vallitalea longa]|nr:amidase domain-containing protein [Vallitalea longa]
MIFYLLLVVVFIGEIIHGICGKSFVILCDWYCYKNNSKYLEPRSAEELNDSWDLADPSPWISVKEFVSYWRSECDEVNYSRAEYRKNHSKIFNKSIYKGDVVILHDGVAGWISMPKHAMIISGYDDENEDFLLAGHSNNRQAYELLNAIDNYIVVEFIYIQ